VGEFHPIGWGCEWWEGVNKVSQPGASAIGRRIRFAKGAFHGLFAISGLSLPRRPEYLRSMTEWIRRQNATDIKRVFTGRRLPGHYRSMQRY
jgi:hypothetical protein